MKFYATIESNRAKKGQGGDFLNIEVFTTNREQPTHRVHVRENATTGVISLVLQAYHLGTWRDLKGEVIYTNVPKDTKAKQQKGEYVGEVCPKYGEKVMPDENGMCSLCGQHKASNY